MGSKQKTVIVTGASQGIGAGVVQAFFDRGYNVVANSRKITKSGAFTESGQLALVDGNIGESAVAAKVVETAIGKFGSIDVERGFHQPGDVENRLGYHVGQLGR